LVAVSGYEDGIDVLEDVGALSVEVVKAEWLLEES
jgi:hypothetical protein